LSLLEQEVQRLGTERASYVVANTEANSTFDQNPQTSLTFASTSLSKASISLGADSEEGSDQIYEGSKSSVATENTSENALGQEFGRLVVDRKTGTSRYVNHRVLTDLGDQVNFVFLCYIAPSKCGKAC
jgi:hypothetical protein